MQVPRVSIRWLMIAVALIGVNIAGWRAVAASDIDVALFLTLIVAALQFALWRGICGSLRFRPFWLAFAVFGTICPMVMLFVYVAPERMGFISWIAVYLETWIDGVDQWLRPYWLPYEGVDWIMGTFFAMNAFIPQLLVAIIGGVVGQWMINPIVQRVRRRREPAIA